MKKRPETIYEQTVRELKIVERKLAKIAAIFEKTRLVKADGKSRIVQVSSHALFNLEGAIITIEHNRGLCDAGSMRTLKRVAQAYVAIPTNDGTGTGQAYIQLNWNQFERMGASVIFSPGGK